MAGTAFFPRLFRYRAMTWLVWVVGFRQARPEEALSTARDVEIILGLSGESQGVRSLLLNNLGVLYYSKGEYDKALDSFGKSLTIRKNTLGPHHPSVMAPLNNIGLIYDNQGENKMAEKCYTCEKGNLIKKKVDYIFLGKNLGKFEAEVCPVCGEQFFNEKTWVVW